MTRKQLSIEQKWRDTLPELNEKQKRYYAAREAKAYGFGGVTAFARATGMNRDTINQGIKEIKIRYNASRRSKSAVPVVAGRNWKRIDQA